MPTAPLAGSPAPLTALIDVARVEREYYARRPDPDNPAERVAFGTSGHRGSSLAGSFNEAHVAAIAQAVCDYRRANGVDGVLYLGNDTHALSAPALRSALEVLAANGVEVVIDGETEHGRERSDRYTPTPAISRAILVRNAGRTTRLADGIVVTPSHNPPEHGGIKYNPPHGGPAETDVTRWIEDRANHYLRDGRRDVRRTPYEKASKT